MSSEWVTASEQQELDSWPWSSKDIWYSVIDYKKNTVEETSYNTVLWIL